MSREQLTDQQAEQGTAAPGTATAELTYGLPAPLYAQVKSLRYGDAEGLASLLAAHQEFSRNLLGVASSHVGLAAVKRAMAMTQHNAVGRPGALTQQQMGPGGEFELEGSAPAAKPAVGRPGALTQQQMGPGGEFELEGSAPAAKPAVGGPGALTQQQIGPGGEFELEGSAPAVKPAVGRPGALTQQQIGPGGEFELEGSAPAKPAVVRPGALTQQQIGPGGEFELEGSAPARPAVGRPGALTQQQIGPGGEFELEGSAPAKPAAEPAWAAGARRYNEAHAELVSEFNELTQGSCRGAGGQLDPQAVARWQRQHGVDADGKVGPHTLAAARHVQAKAGPAGVQADARIPV